MPCRNLRFLVVEDHEFQRKVLVNLLRTLGADAVHEAPDGESALRVIRDTDRPIDIVISDLAMPGMDGMEFVRHLSETGARVALILSSAVDRKLLASVGNMANAYKVRMLGVVPKPVTAVKLKPLMDRYHETGPGPVAPDCRFTLGEITEAWTNDDFAPWFEPKVELATGTVRGMTVVPRWRHATHGWLEAADFLPSINARGLNDDFFWLILQKTVVECVKWRQRGHEVVVAVNLSLRSPGDVDVATRVQRIAQTEGLEPGHLMLTVDEGDLDTELPRGLENLARLRVMGFGLGIDNFGSGLMSVEQLSLVAFTELKIKGSFVTGADFDESARAGLAVGLETAQLLKVRAVAGGISSKHEWNLLYEWGCSLGQGPFISPPLAGEDVPGWLTRWNTQRG